MEETKVPVVSIDPCARNTAQIETDTKHGTKETIISLGEPRILSSDGALETNISSDDNKAPDMQTFVGHNACEKWHARILERTHRILTYLVRIGRISSFGISCTIHHQDVDVPYEYQGTSDFIYVRIWNGYSTYAVESLSDKNRFRDLSSDMLNEIATTGDYTYNDALTSNPPVAAHTN